MPLWKRLWLLFTVIWVVVAALNIVTILAFSEGEIDSRKALFPLASPSWSRRCLPASLDVVPHDLNRGRSPN